MNIKEGKKEVKKKILLFFSLILVLLLLNNVLSLNTLSSLKVTTNETWIFYINNTLKIETFNQFDEPIDVKDIRITIDNELYNDKDFFREDIGVYYKDIIIKNKSKTNFNIIVRVNKDDIFLKTTKNINIRNPSNFNEIYSVIKYNFLKWKNNNESLFWNIIIIGSIFIFVLIIINIIFRKRKKFIN